jgi:hypothetical protein
VDLEEAMEAAVEEAAMEAAAEEVAMGRFKKLFIKTLYIHKP